MVFSQSLGPEACFSTSMRSVGVIPSTDSTVIELTGCDRPGLLSELSAVLTHLKCSVLNAEVWTHNTRAAAVMQVTDDSTGCGISDPERLSRIKNLLRNVLKGSNTPREAKTVVSHGEVHTDRRLHQMMFEDRDYEHRLVDDDSSIQDERQRPDVCVDNWLDKDYSVVTVRCKDRPKLLFDTVCTLTDMQYVVFHGSVDTEGTEAYQVKKDPIAVEQRVSLNPFSYLSCLGFAGVLCETYRWIPCKIRGREAKSHTMS